MGSGVEVRVEIEPTAAVGTIQERDTPVAYNIHDLRDDGGVAVISLGFVGVEGELTSAPPIHRLDREQVAADLSEELEDLFGRLATRWGLAHGDVDPLDALHLSEHTIPYLLEYTWRWYEGNAPETVQS